MNCKHGTPIRQSCPDCRQEIAQRKSGPFWLKNISGDRRAAGTWKSYQHEYEECYEPRAFDEIA